MHTELLTTRQYGITIYLHRPPFNKKLGLHVTHCPFELKIHPFNISVRLQTRLPNTHCYFFKI